jgi:two-component system cell cycle response regulator
MDTIPSLASTVLVVDDDEDALKLVCTVMKKNGMSVLSATNGRDAVKLAEKNWKLIDTFILDIMMPGDLDGYGVCDLLHANPHTRNIPIIILSAKSSSSDMTRSFESGAFQHITKPYDLQYLIAVVKSMIRLRRLERDAAVNAEKYQAIVDNSPLETLLISPDSNILEMNTTFRRNFPAARIGDNPFGIIYSQLLTSMEEHPVQKALATGKSQSGIVKGEHHDRTVYRQVFIAPLKDQDGNITALVDITQDVTKQKELEESQFRQIERHKRALHQQDILAQHLMDVRRQLEMKNKELEEANVKLEVANNNLEIAKAELERLSITDQLTGLYNRRFFDQAFDSELRRSSRYQHPLSVLMFDIDHFKLVNDTHGHPAGDRILQEFAAILKKHLRETDIIARYGGEEFVAILPETDIRIATIIGERLRQSIADNETHYSEKTIKITVSIGVTSQCGPSLNANVLLASADAALYQAKAAGRNHVIAAKGSYVGEVNENDRRAEVS